MKDKNGRDITVGDVCFYSERRFGTNYADSLVLIYEHEGAAKVGTLVVNAGPGVGYVHFAPDPANDLDLTWYGLDVLNKQTGICRELEVLEITREQATIEYAEENFPLEAE